MTILKTQKRLAAQILQCSRKRVWFDSTMLEDIKEAITKADIRSLIRNKVIRKIPSKGVSRVRARKMIIQRRKGRRHGPGSIKGKRGARLSKKNAWMGRIRIQRRFLKELRDKKIVSKSNYRTLYQLAKGGFFRSKRHIKLYIEEHGLK